MVDISEIGSGGGSIAHIDREGLLRVGPQSAGADPGPACYGKGGQEPTFTDACLVLGYLSQNSLLGGEMKIDKRAAEKAVRERIAEPLGMDVLDAAYGIVEISNRLMLGSMQVSSVEKGYDPRDFSTIAYGGAGPMVAAYLAQELGSPEVIIPEHPGIFSALGMLLADIRLDFMRSFEQRATKVDLPSAERIFRELETRAIRTLKKDFDLEYRLDRNADMRYVGQNYDINVPVPSGPFDAKTFRTTEGNFTRSHQRLFGHAQGAEKEFVNLRVTITGMIERPPFQTARRGKPSVVPKGSRLVYFGRGRRDDCPVYDRSSLGHGSRLSGPCVVEGPDSTVVVYPGQSATVDRYADLVIKTR
jgi:N-methylhydantoinase A